MQSSKTQADLPLSALPRPQELSEFAAQGFIDAAVERHQPIVLRNFAAHWPIVMQSKHSLSSVAQQIAAENTGRPVKLVTLPQSGWMFYTDDLRGMNFSVSTATLADAMQSMLQAANSLPHCVQCIGVREHLPTLLPSLDNPLTPNVDPFIWIGNAVRVAPHFDEANNIAVVAAGKRRFTLFPPEQVSNLYIGPLDYTPAGQPISLVDIHAPDLNRFPRYQSAYDAALSVELDAGDAIFIPTPWWHAVESLSSFNVLVNYWWSGRHLSSTLPFPMMMHALQALNAMPNGEREAWKSLLRHYVLTEDAGAHLPDSVRGILGKQSKDNANLIDQWLKSQLR
ncbi:cupin-like domain-containing protein [Alteromonas oceanisediminis]|uniref:cupin-like domain-containing protein n=1 Tax=Alteromonas oceanisediminis TaxID=2836180 RepID=UPI001BDAA0D9|nr:cupin-like domain-containing protein [Alteromonas oceanisediminis]MBT0586475.1 cupin-like domain-containing protein [Alteromonas oceanisediminis]